MKTKRHIAFVFFSILGLGDLLVAVQAAADPTIANAVCSTQDFSQARSVSISRAPLSMVEACADTGDPLAQNELGRRYGLGRGGVTRDSRKSFELYQKAANAGYAHAKANLAYMYLNGEGVSKDLENAYSWALAAANAGNDVGQYALGYLYVFGLGVEKDGPNAEKWFLAAANQGFVPAQGALVELYSDGKLLPKNFAKASMWLRREANARRSGVIWREGDKEASPDAILDVGPNERANRND